MAGIATGVQQGWQGLPERAIAVEKSIEVQEEYVGSDVEGTMPSSIRIPLTLRRERTEEQVFPCLLVQMR